MADQVRVDINVPNPNSAVTNAIRFEMIFDRQTIDGLSQAFRRNSDANATSITFQKAGESLAPGSSDTCIVRLVTGSGSPKLEKIHWHFESGTILEEIFP